MVEHQHVSLFGSQECACTDQEAENLALITTYRAARVADRKQFLAPGYRRHRAAFQNIGDINGEDVEPVATGAEPDCSHIAHVAPEALKGIQESTEGFHQYSRRT